jgi:hypothetical protein
MVVLDSYAGAGGLDYFIEEVWDGVGYTAQTVKATCSIAATLTSLQLTMMKLGLPNTTLRFDVWDSLMNLVDWSATFNASTLSAVGYHNKLLNLTQNYVCFNGEVLWGGCRATAKVLLDGSNCPLFKVTPFAGDNVKRRISGVWDIATSRNMDFVLNGMALTTARRLILDGFVLADFV